MTKKRKYSLEEAKQNWQSSFMYYGTDDPRTKGWKQYYDTMNSGAISLPNVDYKKPKDPTPGLLENTINDVKQNIKDDPIQAALSVASFIPGIDTASDIAQIAYDAKKGNWTDVGLGLGAALIPGLSVGAIKGARHLRKVGEQIFNPYNRAGHTMAMLRPIGYNLSNFDKGDIKTVFGNILKGKSSDYTKSNWYKELLNDAVDSEDMAFIANRENAYRLWGRRTPSPDVYIKNADGTYSYNLKSLQYTNPSGLRNSIADFDDIVRGFGRDMITGNGGIINVTPKGSDMLHIEDVWDLHPFRKSKYSLTDTPITSLVDNNFVSRLEKLHSRFNGEDIFSNIIRDKIENVAKKSQDIATKLDNKLANWEVSPLLGGKPFTLSQDIPVIYKDEDYFIDWDRVKRKGGRRSLEN